MNLIQWLNLKRDIACGKFACFCACPREDVVALLALARELSSEELGYVLSEICNPCVPRLPGGTNPNGGGVSAQGPMWDSIKALVAKLITLVCSAPVQTAIKATKDLIDKSCPMLPPKYVKYCHALVNFLLALIALCAAKTDSEKQAAIMQLCSARQEMVTAAQVLTAANGDQFEPVMDVLNNYMAGLPFDKDQVYNLIDQICFKLQTPGANALPGGGTPGVDPDLKPIPTPPNNLAPSTGRPRITLDPKMINAALKGGA